MRVLLLAIAAALTIALLAAPAFAANPHGPGQSGQPNQSCEEQPSQPPGFSSGGFGNAQGHYAGSPGTPSAAHGGDKAVSQYDVACFQKSQ